MAPGRAAERPDAGGIDAELDGVTADRGDARLHVVDRGRKRVARRESVLDRERREAFSRERASVRLPHLLVAEYPAAAVNQHDPRVGAQAGGQVGIESHPPAVDLVVREVAYHVDARGLLGRAGRPCTRRSDRAGREQCRGDGERGPDHTRAEHEPRMAYEHGITGRAGSIRVHRR
jgi:hypothetical protein